MRRFLESIALPPPSEPSTTIPHPSRRVPFFLARSRCCCCCCCCCACVCGAPSLTHFVPRPGDRVFQPTLTDRACQSSAVCVVPVVAGQPLPTDHVRCCHVMCHACHFLACERQGITGPRMTAHLSDVARMNFLREAEVLRRHIRLNWLEVRVDLLHKAF